MVHLSFHTDSDERHQAFPPIHDPLNQSEGHDVHLLMTESRKHGHDGVAVGSSRQDFESRRGGDAARAITPEPAFGCARSIDRCAAGYKENVRNF